MREPVTAYVGLGANLGDARQAVRRAMDHLNAIPNTVVTKRSSLYVTKPVDAGGPDYVNAVAQVVTRLSAHELLDQMHRIEREAGRERPYRNAPRTLDLDLLLYGSGRIDSPQLTVPHPRMGQRAFVLVPLAQIAPELVSPEELRAVAQQRIDALPGTSLPT
jgi:2-amino-4-hydroxy-6-hydroxymethyldihydropteridine diphosphokinase